MTNNPRVDRASNRLRFFSLRNPLTVGSFLHELRIGMARGFEEFELDFGSVNAAYPNVCVPIAGLLDHYRSVDIDFSYTGAKDFLASTAILQPLAVSDCQPELAKRPLNTVWKYSTAEDVSLLVNAFLQEVSRSAVCESGVIEGLEWCINEVLDNVLQHADVECGYVMGQIHPTTRHIALCIFDSGRGIFNSLKASRHAPRTPLDAITLSMQEGVTRDNNVGQGNGMWGLHNIVRANSGSLGISTGKAMYRISHANDEPSISEKIPFVSHDKHCTTVDFQIDFERPIAVAQALGGYEPVNFRVEDLEDNAGNIIYPLANRSTGTGTRMSGIAIRNELLNLSRQSSNVIILDFSDVAVVSSSFADELIGKLVADVGFISFTQRFRLRNMNDFVEAITNRAVAQRLSGFQNTEQKRHESQTDID